MSSSEVRVLQVSNISPSATKEQIQSLFAYIGRIEECRIYPSAGIPSQHKFAYVKFDREAAVESGQHLTNVVFIDRALICVPASSNTIPDEEIALSSGQALSGQRQLPPNVTSNTQVDADGTEMLYTVDPTITALGLTQYPPLPANTESSKVEEIRRTVYIGNLDKECDSDSLMNFLNATIGEVLYLRMTAGNDHLQCAYAYVEFANQSSVPLALQNNGIEFDNRPLKIQHSRVPIIKPKPKTTDQALEEVEEAIRHKEEREEAPPAELGRGYSPISERSASKRRSVTPPPLRRRVSRSPQRSGGGGGAGRDRERERSPRRSKEGDDRRRRSRSRDRRRTSRDRDRDVKRGGSGGGGDDRRHEEKNSMKPVKRYKDKDEKKDRKEKDRKRSRSRSQKKEKTRKKHSRSRSPTPKKPKKDKERHRDDTLVKEEEKLRIRLEQKLHSSSNGD